MVSYVLGGFSTERNAHGHNLRDIFINDALCSQIETIIVWVIIRGRRIVDDIIKCDCDWSLYDGFGLLIEQRVLATNTSPIQ